MQLLSTTLQRYAHSVGVSGPTGSDSLCARQPQKLGAAADCFLSAGLDALRETCGQSRGHPGTWYGRETTGKKEAPRTREATLLLGLLLLGCAYWKPCMPECHMTTWAQCQPTAHTGLTDRTWALMYGIEPAMLRLESWNAGADETGELAALSALPAQLCSLHRVTCLRKDCL